uniref:Uncharacterized protein n=1 Tax=Sphaerodactylus townsendi TaxID=933632 RepID=A0ACB8G4N6_9SAUR
MEFQGLEDLPSDLDNDKSSKEDIGAGGEEPEDPGESPIASMNTTRIKERFRLHLLSLSNCLCGDTPDVQPTVSKEQLNTLLEQYMQSQRTRLALPTSEGSFFDGMNPDFDQSENITQDSRNGLLEDTYGVVMLRKQNMVETMDKGVCSKETIETAGCNDSKALVESHLSEEPVTEKKENDDQVVQQEMLCTSNPAGYFMSIALSTGKPKKPSFLDEPFYCTSMNNELSTDVDIPSMPLKTRGGEVLNKPVE